MYRWRAPHDNPGSVWRRRITAGAIVVVVLMLFEIAISQIIKITPAIVREPLIVLAWVIGVLLVAVTILWIALPTLPHEEV